MALALLTRGYICRTKLIVNSSSMLTVDNSAGSVSTDNSNIVIINPETDTSTTIVANNIGSTIIKVE